MNNELISIIVPVYNVEKYLHRCINSIVQQTYKNLEIILIDDGSKDNCYEICMFYKEKDKRIKVIHQQNGGLSAARNTGLENATGKYISFIDSDDWVHPDFIWNLYYTMKNTNSQIVECLALSTTEYIIDEKSIELDCIEKKEFDGAECFTEFIKGNFFRQTVWNKLYKKEILEKLVFEVGKIHEDEFWTYQVFEKAKHVSLLNFKGYYYFQREDSIMGGKFSQKNMDGFEAKYNRLEFVKKNHRELLQIELINFLLTCMYFYSSILESDLNTKKEMLKYVKNHYNLTFRQLDFGILTIRKKMWFSTFFLIPNLYCKINKKLHIV